MSVVDTNLLVNASIKTAPDHARAKSALARLDDQPASMTRQIVREFLSAITRPQPFMAALPMADATKLIRDFIRRFDILEDGPGVWRHFLMLSERFSFAGKQVHDANIVATMLAHGETKLLTFNVKDFRRFAPLIEVIEP